MGSCMLYPMHRYTCNWANADFYRFYSLRVSLIHVGNVMSSSSKARLQSCILPHVESTPLLGCPGQHGNQTETKRCQSDPDCRFSSWLTWKKPKSQTNKPKIKKIFFFSCCSLSLLCCAKGHRCVWNTSTLRCLQWGRKGKALHQNCFLPGAQWPTVPVACAEEQRLLLKVACSRKAFHKYQREIREHISQDYSEVEPQ